MAVQGVTRLSTVRASNILFYVTVDAIGRFSTTCFELQMIKNIFKDKFNLYILLVLFISATLYKFI